MASALFISPSDGGYALGGYCGIVEGPRDLAVLKYLEKFLIDFSLGMDNESKTDFIIFFINTESKGVKDYQRVYGAVYEVRWEIGPNKLIAHVKLEGNLHGPANQAVTRCSVDYSGKYVPSENIWGEPMNQVKYVKDLMVDSVNLLSEGLGLRGGHR